MLETIATGLGANSAEPRGRRGVVGARRLRAAATAREGRRHLVVDAIEERFQVLAGPARDGRPEADVDPHAPRYGEEAVAEQAPRLVDHDRQDGCRGRLLEERQRPGPLELPEFPAPRARALREDHRRGSSRTDTSAELADGGQRPGRVAAVDQHVPAAAKVVRDARDPAAERALGDVLREAREEQAPEDGDVEHALVVRDDDVAAAGLEAGGALDGEPHPAEVEGPDERDLQRPGDVLLWALAEETRAALGHVEDEQDQGEDR